MSPNPATTADSEKMSEFPVPFPAGCNEVREGPWSQRKPLQLEMERSFPLWRSCETNCSICGPPAERMALSRTSITALWRRLSQLFWSGHSGRAFFPRWIIGTSLLSGFINKPSLPFFSLFDSFLCSSPRLLPRERKRRERERDNGSGRDTFQRQLMNSYSDSSERESISGAELPSSRSVLSEK